MRVVVNTGKIAENALGLAQSCPMPFQKWVAKRFYEYCITYVDAELSIEDGAIARHSAYWEGYDYKPYVVERFVNLMSSDVHADILDWLRKRRADADLAVANFIPGRDIAILAISSDERVPDITDWLRSTDPSEVRLHAKLDRMTWAQAAEHADRWHERMAKQKAEETGDPLAFKVVKEFDDGIKAVRITSQAGCEYEGAMMGHCVGSAGYFGRSIIYSIRDAKNRPHATIEAVQDGYHTTSPPKSKTLSERRYRVLQIKGKANKPVPAAYRPAVRGLLDILNARAINNLENIGCVSLGSSIIDVTAADAPCDRAFLAQLFKEHGASLGQVSQWQPDFARDTAIYTLELAGAAPHLLEAAEDYLKWLTTEAAKMAYKMSERPDFKYCSYVIVDGVRVRLGA